MGTWTPGPGPTEGDDSYLGDGTDETIISLGGNDYILAGGGDFFTNGGDTAFGGAGDDIIQSDTVDITEFGSGAVFGNDTFDGDDGDDILIGGLGDDTLLGGAGDDILWGGIGFADPNRTLHFGRGPNVFQYDVLDGGAGFDSAILTLLPGVVAAPDAANPEKIVYTNGFASSGSYTNIEAITIAAASQVGADTLIDFGAGQTLTLQNVTLASLTSGDFLFGP